jgi:hypothetical protein
MELLQWLDSTWRIVLAGFFALLPGTLVWLAVLGTMNVFRKLGRGQRDQILGKMRPA